MDNYLGPDNTKSTNFFMQGYDDGKDAALRLIDNFCLNVSREYEEKADTYAKGNEDMNTCFWQGAVFALKAVRKEVERLKR